MHASSGQCVRCRRENSIRRHRFRVAEGRDVERCQQSSPGEMRRAPFDCAASPRPDVRSALQSFRRCRTLIWRRGHAPADQRWNGANTPTVETLCSNLAECASTKCCLGYGKGRYTKHHQNRIDGHPNEWEYDTTVTVILRSVKTSFRPISIILQGFIREVIIHEYAIRHIS